MSPDTDNKLPPLEAWQANNLRMTAFLSPDANIEGQTWWSELVGSEPETINTQSRLKQRAEAGEYRDGTLLLQTQPTRIDWLYTPIETNGGLPMPGPFVEQTAIFRELINKWLASPSCPPLDRLAFGALLLQPVESAMASYRLLARYTKLPIDLDHSSDFLYRINRPRTSNIVRASQLLINRLSTWSTVARVTMTLTPLLSSRTSISDVACSLELDISTAPDVRSLPREQLSELFDELSELGREIAEQGDIP